MDDKMEVREWPWPEDVDGIAGGEGEEVAPPVRNDFPGAEYQAEAVDVPVIVPELPPSPALGGTEEVAHILQSTDPYAPNYVPPAGTSAGPVEHVTKQAAATASGTASGSPSAQMDTPTRPAVPSVRTTTTIAPTPAVLPPTASDGSSLSPQNKPIGTRSVEFITVTATPTVLPSALSAASSSSSTPVGAIVGGVLGALALLILLGAGFWFLRRRRRRYAPLKPLPREARPLVQPFEPSSPVSGAGTGVRKSMTDTVLVPTERSAGFAGAPRARDSMDINQLNQANLLEIAEREQRAEMLGAELETPGAGPSRTTGSGSSERRYDPPAYASWPQ